MNKRTLFVHTGGIGDFLLACPALSRLAAEGPVDVAGAVERLGLAVSGGLAVRAHSLHGLDFESVFTEPSARLQAFLREFDRAVIWMRDDGALGESIRGCGVNEVSVFPGLPPEDWGDHASAYYCSCLGFEPARRWRLELLPWPEAAEVIIHPGSGSPKKNWPWRNFQEVGRRLREGGWRVQWTLGPAELDTLEETTLRDFSQDDCLGELSLVELGRRLANARLYLGNDSGITHLAAGVGCPTVAVFGPTNPGVWGPLGDRVCVVADEEWPSVAAVMDGAAWALGGDSIVRKGMGQAPERPLT